MSTFIKRCREEAGLTQTQLAEKMNVSVIAVQNWERGRTKINLDRYYELSAVFNVPVDDLIKEMLIEADKSRPDVWPAFLFDEDTNAIIDTLHLNLAQQDLFGLMYIYGSDYLQKTEIDKDTFNEDLKNIPYGFIDRVGSIRFMNQAEGLHKVIRHVKSDFLMKVLKQNPESEFDIKKLSKELICEFIDKGYKPINDYYDGDILDIETDEYLHFKINMRKAKILLPVLDKIGSIRFAEGHDIPEEFFDSIPGMFNRESWDKRSYSGKCALMDIRNGIETVTGVEKDEEGRFVLYVNEKGYDLLKWLKG